jgi:hypothetical protein
VSTWNCSVQTRIGLRFDGDFGQAFAAISVSIHPDSALLLTSTENFLPTRFIDSIQSHYRAEV